MGAAILEKDLGVTFIIDKFWSNVELLLQKVIKLYGLLGELSHIGRNREL